MKFNKRKISFRYSIYSILFFYDGIQKRKNNKDKNKDDNEKVKADDRTNFLNFMSIEMTADVVTDMIADVNADTN